MNTVLLDAEGMRRTLQRMAHEIVEANHGAEGVVCLGILRRGYPLAKRLAFAITTIEGITIPCGKLDISPFRDDRETPEGDLSEIPFSITGKNLILVDEVIFSGRTVRAALQAISRHGRPKRIQLAVLIDRGFRELPIQPNFVGREAITDLHDHVAVKFQELDGEDIVVQVPRTVAGASGA
jgi:pyrimidine operon attenuation protein/uracil phosphoribosyltransferase